MQFSQRFRPLSTKILLIKSFYKPEHSTSRVMKLFCNWFILYCSEMFIKQYCMFITFYTDNNLMKCLLIDYALQILFFLST